MKTVRTIVGCPLGLAVMTAGCAGPVPPPPAGPAEPRFAIAACDVRGLEMALDALPRRPEFLVSSTRALDPVELVLLLGSPDADLQQDLAGLPLRAASAARVVASAVSQSGTQLRLAPRSALDPATEYTLALPGSARVKGGAALGNSGPAFVAALKTLGSASAGAAWVATLPAARSSGVPPNLEAAFVALDGAVAVDGGDFGAAIWLETPAGAAVAARVDQVDCADVETRARTCVRLGLEGALQPNARYVLRTGSALRDLHGAPVEPLSAWFDTAGAPDLEPPTFEAIACQPDESATAFGCLLIGDAWVEIRAHADESVRVVVRSLERQAAQLTAAGGSDLRLGGFEPGEPFDLAVQAIDLAGNTSEAQLESVAAPPLATLSITEVLADPSGPDAAQEYVEITNFGSAALDLQGISLADGSDKPSLISSRVELPAGARALLVATDFDPSLVSFEPESSAAEPATATPLDLVAPGTRLIRVGSSLTKAGLANAGEPLFLRAADQHRLSAAPARVAAAGRCLQRRSSDPRSGRIEDFAEAPCSPGR
jgi:hypothetical protein